MKETAPRTSSLTTSALALAFFLGACSAETAGPNRAPVASAGIDRQVAVDQETTLDGSASWDPDGDPLRYHWTLLAAPAGAQAKLSAPEDAQTVLAPDRAGNWIVALEVHDRHGLSSGRDIVQLRALPGCTEDEDCQDADPCTADRCEQGTCTHTSVPDCPDDCPDDPQKTEPGQCGCGIADTDGDGDGTADCIDGCPDDDAKTDPGICGCGQPEQSGDSDGDGVVDCADGCPEDPGKTLPGQCGCGVADLDRDADGTADCVDGCPDDPDKTAPGECGCGQPEDWGDDDGDGVSNCADGCPEDAQKTEPGLCGCGQPDDGLDSDGDGQPDCVDGCPNDADKIDPGQCGCGFSDADSDGDSVADCVDGCPSDPNKFTPGQCGCLTADTDSDGDLTADCVDGCPQDPDKTEAGLCGCGSPDADDDGDGAVNCLDGCPQDAQKTEPGQCGCGESEVDSDNDGSADCVDECPSDPDKTEPGVCGCNNDDTDDDGDGVANCIDGCPADPLKTEEGVCGCGVSDDDSDGDGTPDCSDDCPADPNKTEPGLCGCGAPDSDADADGFCDVDDCAPNNPDIHPGAPETCNGVDDDCNDLADDSGCPCAVAHYGQHTYQFCNYEVNWTTARDTCRQTDYELATVDDTTENAALWGFIGTLLSSGSAWHGLNDRADEGQWRWVSGSSATFRSWVSGQPDNFFDQDCALWWDGEGGRWNDRDCSDDSYRFVCESNCGIGTDEDGDGYAADCDCAPLDPTVHPGATEVCNLVDDDCNGVIDRLPACPCTVAIRGGHHYLFCNEAVDWPTAQSDCSGYGAALVSLEDTDENSWVYARVAAWLDSGDAWLGYNDRDTEGVWVWDNGSSSTWTHWSGGEPNDAGGVEDCAHWYSDGTWNDTDCAGARPYVCEYDY